MRSQPLHYLPEKVRWNGDERNHSVSLGTWRWRWGLFAGSVETVGPGYGWHTGAKGYAGAGCWGTLDLVASGFFPAANEPTLGGQDP